MNHAPHSHPTEDPSMPSPPPDRIAPGVAALWASAFVLLAMILGQASRLSGPGMAYAGDVSQAGDLIALTADIGNDEDMLFVLNSRMDRLLAYGISNGHGGTLEFRGRFTPSTFFQSVQAPPQPRRR